MADFPPSRTGLDPQHDPDAIPRVGSPPSLWPIAFAFVGALGLGTIVFLQMSSNRAQLEQAKLMAAAKPALAAVQPAPILAAPQPQIASAPQPAPAPIVEAPPPAPIQSGPTQAEIDHLRAPALVVDLSDPNAKSAQISSLTGQPLDAKALAGAIGAQASPSAGQLNSDERFAQRLGVGDASHPARAHAAIDLANTVVEGAVLPAVLETAINSDLPGYVRAVISRDVHSFDGSKVLIPHGSRLIGQYRSGVALGASRAFVIWTRLIRPDGVAIDLASPATDGLGRAGLDGDVNRHFLQRFGGAILLSLINLGVNAATSTTQTAIVISSARAGGDAAGVALQKDNDISPTVTVPPGAPVRVFVSQDLDFSGVAEDKPGSSLRGATAPGDAEPIPAAPTAASPPAAAAPPPTDAPR